jgi:hypothetical protein
MILILVSVRHEEDGNVNMKKAKAKAKAKIKKVVKGLKKASKTHAAQAKTLQGVLKNESRSSNRKTK